MAMRESDAAHGIHQLVLVHGHQRAREMVPQKQRQLVDIAAEVMADDRQNIGISYTGFCLTSLPHKRLPDDAPWQKHGHRVTLLVEPGRLKTLKGEMKLYGVPYGARARMILLYLQTQAVRSGSPQVALGRSMRGLDGEAGACRWRGNCTWAARAGGPPFGLHPKILLGRRRGGGPRLQARSHRRLGTAVCHWRLDTRQFVGRSGRT